MARSRMVLNSNIRLAAKYAKDGLEDAVEKWMDVGENAIKDTMTKRESATGYNFNDAYDSVSSEKRGELDAAIIIGVWWWHFFEYGTVYIPPTPVLRPAKTKADRAFKAEAGDAIARQVRRAAVR